MKKIALFTLLLCAAFPVLAAPQNGNLKLSLWDQIAIAAPNNIEDISGLDFGIGSKAATVTGLQLDLVWSEVTYDLRGVSHAWLVSMANHVKGLQAAAFVKGNEVTGVQFGAVNLANSITGVQAGFFNQADYLLGLQFGFVNYARDIERGLQIGLLNIAENGFVPVMVFANGRF